MNVIVIGAGASGLIAAIAAAENGASVVVLEQQEKAGKKLSVTGNGKCNLSNIFFQKKQGGTIKYSDRLFGNAEVIQTVLDSFGLEETLQFFKKIGVFTYCETVHGGFYPRSNQAVSVTNALVQYAEQLGVKIKNNNAVQQVEKTQNGFAVYTGVRMECERLIVATGGHYEIADGMTGYDIARQFGHQVSSLYPALTGIVAKDLLNKASGVRVHAKLYTDFGLSEQGEVQITSYGLSGIPVFNLSRNLYPQQTIYLDFTDGFSDDFGNDSEFINRFYRDIQTYNKRRTLLKIMSGMFDEKLLGVIFEKAGVRKNLSGEQTTETVLQKIFALLKRYPLTVGFRRSFSQAQVTQGGVSLDGIDGASMQSKYCPNLYFCGEILDVDGQCGGYNLQWAWSSGYLAGKNSSR